MKFDWLASVAETAYGNNLQYLMFPMSLLNIYTNFLHFQLADLGEEWPKEEADQILVLETRVTINMYVLLLAFLFLPSVETKQKTKGP